MKTVIEMAREAAAVHGHTFKAVPSPETIEFITAFAELVRADERNSWPLEMEAMERQVNILTDALAQEREACAKVCDQMAQRTQDIRSAALESAAQNIRARSDT